MKTDRKKPVIKSLYRARLSCKIGCDALDYGGAKKLPPGMSPLEYAVYNLLQAVDEIAAHLQQRESEG